MLSVFAAEASPLDVPTQYLPLGADYIRLYAQIKGWLYEKNGPYRDAAGLVANGPITGMSVPRLTFGEASELYHFWGLIFQRLGGALSKRWLPLDSIFKANREAFQRYSLWLLQNKGADSDFVSLRGADEFFQLLGRFVQELDAGLYYGFSTEADYQRAWWALATSWQDLMPAWVPGVKPWTDRIAAWVPPGEPPEAVPFLPTVPETAPAPESETPKKTRWGWAVGVGALAVAAGVGAVAWRRR